MISATDLGGSPIYINPDLIEKIELVPDTVLVMVNGHRTVVREKPEEVIARLEEFKRRCNDPVTILRDELKQAVARRHG